LPIRQCIEESILLLTLSPIVESFTILKKRETEGDGFLRAKAGITDGSLLEISMYWELIEDDVRLVAYRFHWQDEKTRLINRWDNAKHHPEIKTFPFHMHAGEENKVKESGEMELSDVLRKLEAGAGKPGVA
jgi:hypothetical protein